jgi:hypothetical protein
MGPVRLILFSPLFCCFRRLLQLDCAVSAPGRFQKTLSFFCVLFIYCCSLRWDNVRAHVLGSSQSCVFFIYLSSLVD